MDRERRIELLGDCSLDRLLGLGQRLERRCKEMLDSHYPEKNHRLSGEQRRYLAAVDAWIREPTDENFKIKRAALFAMMSAQ